MLRGQWRDPPMTVRQPCPSAPGPLEDFAVEFDSIFASLGQRRSFRNYLSGLLAPRDRNKTLTALAGAEPVVPAHNPQVQRLQYFLSEAAWRAEALTARRLELLQSDPAIAAGCWCSMIPATKRTARPPPMWADNTSAR